MGLSVLFIICLVLSSEETLEDANYRLNQVVTDLVNTNTQLKLEIRELLAENSRLRADIKPTVKDEPLTPFIKTEPDLG